MTKLRFAGYNASLAAENPVLGLLYKWSGYVNIIIIPLAQLSAEATRRSEPDVRMNG
jgi:hypothetical protein